MSVANVSCRGCWGTESLSSEGEQRVERGVIGGWDGGDDAHRLLTFYCKAIFYVVRDTQGFLVVVVLQMTTCT